MGKVDNIEICTRVEAGAIWEISVYHLNFNLKLLLKKEVLKKKKKKCLPSFTKPEQLPQSKFCVSNLF